MNLYSVRDTEFALVYISNKQIFSVTATELDFVFYNKTFRDISKILKINLLKINLFPLCIATFNNAKTDFNYNKLN